MAQENNLALILAPIVLFVYNRPWHTRQTVEALQKNELAGESELFIYADAPKNENSIEKVNEVREYIKSIDGFKKVTIIEREKNWGLANSIIDGVTKIVNEYGKIIVLEDDLVTSPYFLKFMNESLEVYKDEEKVYSITGYSFSDDISNMDSTYFLKLTSSWSWATWADKWQAFKRDKQELELFLKEARDKKAFNFDDSYDYISMVKNQLDNKIDSWAIYWYFNVFKRNGLTLYPAKSLVQNIGFDASGIHCGDSAVQKYLHKDFYPIFTNIIEEQQENRSTIANILRGENRSLIKKLKSRLKRILKKTLTPKQKQFISILISKIELFFYKKKIGENTYIDQTVNVLGWKNIFIGKNTCIGEYSWLNINNRVDNFEHIKIGDNCYLGKRVAISSAEQILIKDYCLMGDDCKLIGANHIYQNPLQPYAFTGAISDGKIIVGVNVWFGAMVCVIGDITIGYGSVIGASSVVTKSIPPFSIAVGNPCRIIKRFDFSTNEWISVINWKDSLEKYFPSEEDYLEQMKANVLDINIFKRAASHNFGNVI